MLLKTSYILRVTKINGHLPEIFYIKNIGGLINIDFIKEIQDADSFDDLAEAYYAHKKVSNFFGDDAIDIVKMKISYEEETVQKEEIRAAILDSAKAKLTKEEYAAIQYNTLPNKYHKEHGND